MLTATPDTENSSSAWGDYFRGIAKFLIRASVGDDSWILGKREIIRLLPVRAGITGLPGRLPYPAAPLGVRSGLNFILKSLLAPRESALRNQETGSPLWLQH